MHTHLRLRKFCIHNLTPKAFGSAVMWALVLSVGIVVAAAFLGRAARNLKAALTDKPDVGIYFLLEEENLTDATLLRVDAENTRRDYLAETENGQMLVTLKKGETEWYVARSENLHKNTSW